MGDGQHGGGAKLGSNSLLNESIRLQVDGCRCFVIREVFKVRSNGTGLGYLNINTYQNENLRMAK